MQKKDCQKSCDELPLFVHLYVGVSNVYGYCMRCGQPFQFPKDREYRLCPYCGANLFEEIRGKNK